MTPIILLNAKEKLRHYHHEACIRGLSQNYWRKYIAEKLYNLADRIESQTKVGGQVQAY